MDLRFDRSVPSQRHQGDGAPTQESERGNERTPSTQAQSSLPEKAPSSFSFNVEVDLMQWFLLAFSLATRMWRLDYPREAVFDEVHYGKAASLYLQRTFHFDAHPPLGKMLIALAGYYSGYTGDFKFDKIGTDFGPELPVWHLRFFPAFLGSLVVPLVYQLAVELRLSRWAAALAASLYMLDNALLVQSRFMLMEGIFLFFMSLTLLAYLKFREANLKDEFCAKWWMSLITMGVSGTLALSVRYVAAFTLGLVVFLCLRDLWRMLPDPAMTDGRLLRHVGARFAMLCALPVGLYLSLFYIHLSILTKAGPHDNVLTSVFQASLEGGLAAITRGQPLEVAYGSQITLRSTYGKPCWLHSHDALYPIRYPDKRGSSHQQQVTCYQFKDVNNWWIVKDPNNASLIVDNPVKPVQDGAIIQLVHGMTGRSLNSHDVTAPMTPQNQEVSGYIDHNISAPAQNLWRVEILNKEGESDTWKTIQSNIRLHHVNSSQALKLTGKQLPDWAFFQMEVVTDRNVNQDATIWNVEEHRYSENSDEEKNKKDMAQAEMIPLKPTYMSFWAKFLELQIKMFCPTSGFRQEHQYSSNPWDWPLLDTNIAYWMRKDDYAQIHLVGNPVLWYSALIVTAVCVVIIVFLLLRRHRYCFDIDEHAWERLILVGEILLSGYLLHYIPYLLMDRTLFLYLYLPALFYQIILTAALIDFIHRHLRSRIMHCVFLVSLAAWFALVCNAFITLLPVTYGFRGLSKAELQAVTWRSTWNFLTKPE